MAGVPRPPRSRSGGLIWFDTKPVVDGILQLLLAAEISFGGLDRDVPQQELDLIQLAASKMAQTGAGASLMPHPGLCRIEYEATAFGAELAHQDDQSDSA